MLVREASLKDAAGIARVHVYGRGIGSHLVTNLAQLQVKKGMTSMIVWVLRDNLFRAF